MTRLDDFQNLSTIRAFTGQPKKSVVRAWPCENDCRDECGEVECDRALAAAELAGFAYHIAPLIANQCRHVPEKSRREFAAGIADQIDDALFSIGGRVDLDVFMALAGFAKEAKA